MTSESRMRSTDWWQARELLEDVVVLPHHEEEAAERGLPANTYVLLAGTQAVAVDAVFVDTLAGLNQLAARGIQLAALVITHRHVIGQAEILPDILARWDIPVYLHPLDANHPQGRRFRGLTYRNPVADPLLLGFDIEATLFPGHTEGHVMLYRRSEGGTLLTGDCAVGPATAEAEGNEWKVTRPPVFFNVSDSSLRQGWERFDLPVTSLFPYHGVPLVKRPAAIAEGLMRLRSPERVTTLGI